MKEYKITKEMREVFFEYLSASKCRDRALNICFFTKTAIKYGKIAEKKRLEFWEMVYKLYPELNGKQMQYNSDNMFVEELE